MTLTLHIPLPDLSLVWTLLRYVVCVPGLLWLAMRIYLENKQ